MLENEIVGKERFIRALEQYEILCYEKYAPYEGDICYSARYLKQMSRIISRKPVLTSSTLNTAVKYAAAVTVAALAAVGSYVTVDAMQNEYFNVENVPSEMFEYTLAE